MMSAGMAALLLAAMDGTKGQDACLDCAGISVVSQSPVQLVLRLRDGSVETYVGMPHLNPKGWDTIVRDGVPYVFALRTFPQERR